MFRSAVALIALNGPFVNAPSDPAPVVEGGEEVLFDGILEEARFEDPLNDDPPEDEAPVPLEPCDLTNEELFGFDPFTVISIGPLPAPVPVPPPSEESPIAPVAVDIVPPPLDPLVRDRSNVRLAVPGGFIAYYDGRKDFYANCKRHVCDCRKVRTSTGKEAKPQQGRPLGFLMAWLQMKSKNNATHSSILDETIDWEIRSNARIELAKIPGSEHLFNAERSKRPGEWDEPEFTP